MKLQKRSAAVPLRIAVTGASGFIGRHVLNVLSMFPVQVSALARNEAALSAVASDIEIIRFDIADADSDCYERAGRPDLLIHLAWDGLPNYKAMQHIETELPRQYNFLKHMIEAGLPSLVVTGTCFEYGMQSGELAEDLKPLPNSAYSKAKDSLRCRLELLQKVHPFVLKWLRLFYMYGEGQNSGSLYPLLKQAVERGDRSFRMSGGEQLRDYLPAEEVARLIVQTAMHDPASGIINICSGRPVSVRSLVEQWLADNGWEIGLELGFYPYADYEPMAFWGSRKRLDSILHDIAGGAEYDRT